MTGQIERRGKWMWYLYVACVLGFAATAPFYGPVALAFGVVGTAFGIERVAALWGAVRFRWSFLFLCWLGAGAIAMLLPIWGHDAVVDKNGVKIIRHHDHHLWEKEHPEGDRR